MRVYRFCLCHCTALLASSAAGMPLLAWTQLPAPARRGTDTDTYHGIVVSDPYRWMEDS